MTKNQKIVVGIGAIALAYFIFKDKIKGMTSFVSADGTESDIRITVDKCKAPCRQNWLTRRCKCPSAPINLSF